MAVDVEEPPACRKRHERQEQGDTGERDSGAAEREQRGSEKRAHGESGHLEPLEEP